MLLKMCVHSADMRHMESDALALEYKRNYGIACGNLDVADLINNPAASGKCSVFGLRLKEELFYVGSGQISPFGDYGADATLIA